MDNYPYNKAYVREIIFKKGAETHMRTLTDRGKKVARRSFAAMLAVLLSVTTIGTNFFGFGSDDSSSIVGSFDAFAADTVNYGPNETYYDAGVLTMNAYYDSSSGTQLAELSSNYKATDWDVTSAESYVGTATQNGNTGITVLSTTDIASSSKIGTASKVSDGGDGQNGIMCYSEYLDTILSQDKKSVPDYEAPAALATSYQYIAKGETSLVDDEYQIEWTIFAWPSSGQFGSGTTTAAVKQRLDTPSEIETEWSNLSVDENGLPSATSDASVFYDAQPQWYSGNQGAFDDWCKRDSEKYLMNNGLWARIATTAVQFKQAENGTVTFDQTPSVTIGLFKPSNTSEDQNGADVKYNLTENSDSESMPLYTAYDSYTEGNLSNMSLLDIVSSQTSLTDLNIPTYNIRKQLYTAWNVDSAAWIKGVTNFTCKLVNGETSTASKNFGNSTAIKGVRLYAINAMPRIDASYANTYISCINNASSSSTLEGVTYTSNMVSAYQSGKAYGGSGNKDLGVLFVFNEDDISTATGVVHIDQIPDQVLNLTDIYAAYGDDLKATDMSKVAKSVPNNVVPYVIRADAYFDATDDYQRAAGKVYGRIDAVTIDTDAVDTVTSGKTATPSSTDKVTDTVTYTGLDAGTNYVLKGSIVKYSDSATEVATATATFTASASSGETTVEFSFDSSSITSGEKLVVFEKLYASDGTTLIASHEDVSDTDQTITYKSSVVNTKATLGSDESYIKDVITYSGLTAGDWTITTTVFDSTANKMLSGSATNTVTVDSTGAGTKTVTFADYDATSLAGHTLVVYESLTNGSSTIEHKDKTDALQTVTLSSTAEITTVAESKTGSKYLDAVDGEVIIDTVNVSGLAASTKYTAVTQLYDITAGSMVKASNSTLTWESAFTTDSTGSADFEVEISDFGGASLAGHNLVVYETIYTTAGTEVIAHEDSTDTDQTVYVNSASIATVLTDSSGNKEITSSASMIFKDTIGYADLVPGNPYYMVSTLVDQSTGTVLSTSSGTKAIVTSTVFTGNSTGTNAGSASFTFSNMATQLSGKSVVAYNEIYRILDDSVTAGATVTSSMETELVAAELDLTNTNQTVSIDAEIVVTDPTIDTVAKSSSGTKTIPLATNSVIKDTVTYTNLTAGKTYTLVADVYDTSTSSRAIGYTTVKSQDFTASDSGDGSVVMTIDVNTTELSGHKLVVYETLKLNDDTIVTHRDLTDSDQTVTVNNTYQASLDTVAVDATTGGKTIPLSSDASIKDTVTYDGLDTDQSYTLTTSVYDKSTGSKASSISDVTTTFTPSDSEGTVTVTIPVDGTKFTAGQSLVVYEKLTTTSKTNSSSSSSSTTTKTVTVATHEDISDTDQTVTFVKMSTYLTGDGSTSKTVHVGTDAYVIDTASFTGLTPNRTYSITTQLIDVAANSSAVTLDSTSTSDTASGSVVASRTMEFTPTTANGSIAMQINVNTTAYAGHQLVAIATVTDKSSGKVIATHTNKSNTDQTVTVQTRVEAQTGVYSVNWILLLIMTILASAFASYGIGCYYDKRH